MVDTTDSHLILLRIDLVLFSDARQVFLLKQLNLKRGREGLRALLKSY